jgi:hypothetical protein
MTQIISITCDNTSNNNTMVKKLEDLLDIFPGESNRMCCFDHIVNLVAKSIIRQFDLLKTKGKESFDKVLRELMVSASDLDEEELATWEGESGEVDQEDDNADGWVDEREEMSETEQQELDENIQPIQRVLVKVSIEHWTLSRCQMLNNWCLAP